MIFNNLKEVEIKLEDILLDPNNPRFSELGEELNSISESRFYEEKIQRNTELKMRNPIFEVSELRDTIKTVGFLPMDRIVVREWKGDGKNLFVVIEGNRRITALKWLLELHETGKENLSNNQIENIKKLNVLILEGHHPNANIIIPGLRHVSGIKEWGAYQKAKTIHALRESGLSPQEAAQSIGLSTRAANQAYRCFLALEQMRSHEEFGEKTTPKMYSYFEEIFKRPSIKNWLDWDDGNGCFQASERLDELYSWIVPSDDGDTPKLPEAKSIRELGLIINDDDAMNIFRAEQGSLVQALARYESEQPKEWIPSVKSALHMLRTLPTDLIANFHESDIKLLSELTDQVKKTIVYHNKLKEE